MNFNMTLSTRARELYNLGEREIAALELVKAQYHPHDGELPPFLLKDVTARIPKIRSILAEKFGMRVCCLGTVYYKHYKGTIITSDVADKCVAGGKHGGKACGLWFSEGNDLIYLASLERDAKRTKGDSSKTFTRILDVDSTGDVSEEAAEDLVITAIDGARPEDGGRIAELYARGKERHRLAAEAADAELRLLEFDDTDSTDDDD